MKYIQCPYCGSNLSVPEEYKNDKHLHCSICGQNFDNPIVLKKQKHPQTIKTGWTTKQKIGLCVFIFIICNILYHCGAFTSTDLPQIGDRVITISNTWGTIDEAASKELDRAMVADDELGRYELVRKGKAQFIWRGTSGKVIRSSWSKFQVRFQDGSLYWVPTDAVKKIEHDDDRI